MITEIILKDASVRLATKWDLGEDDCHLMRNTDRLGYGWISCNGKLRLAHRVAYETEHGVTLTSDQHLDHLCRNRNCVNPDHLEIVTHRENVLRGVGPTSVNAAKTYCKSGHPLSGENLYVIPSTGSRVCRTCRKADSLARRDPNARPRGPWAHCKRGHELSGDNLYMNPGSGQHVCRICKKERQHGSR